MQNILVKIYGYLKPCKEQWLPALESSLYLLGAEAEGVLRLEGSMLQLSYEGIYFPLEDFLRAAAPLLGAESEGKIDYLDLEAWELTRYRFENGFITSAKSDLNNVLAFSGH